MSEIQGPVDVMVVKFPGNRFSGEIIPALRDLVANGIIRIIDLVFVRKHPDGSVEAFELSDLSADELADFATVRAETGALLNEDDVSSVAMQLEDNSSAGLLVWENVWASAFARAVQNAHGRVIAFEPIPAETVQAAREAAVKSPE
jgi:hypothetical protein